MLFGVLVFGRGSVRWLAAAAVLLLAGPRIVLLLPVWGLGVALYHAGKRRRVLAGAAAAPLFVVFLVAFAAALLGFNPAAPLSQAIAARLDAGYWHAGPLRLFIGDDAHAPSDLMLRLLFTGTVACSRPLFAPLARSRVADAVRLASSYTFSLYLYHAPLLVFVHPLLLRQLPATWVPAAEIVLILAGAVLLGRLTEQRKAPYTRLFGTLLARRVARAD